MEECTRKRRWIEGRQERMYEGVWMHEAGLSVGTWTRAPRTYRADPNARRVSDTGPWRDPVGDRVRLDMNQEV
jgi:hypothetical protein